MSAEDVRLAQHEFRKGLAAAATEMPEAPWRDLNKRAAAFWNTAWDEINRLEAGLVEAERQLGQERATSYSFRDQLVASEPRLARLEEALVFWVDRADHFEERLPEDKQYVRARGVLTPAYKLGRALAATEEGAER